MRWLQNYFGCNLSFLPEAWSDWREMIFTVIAITAQIISLALLASAKKS